jgi:methylmalonyl-CoA/ethylmalonyl-CoA epimerase
MREPSFNETLQIGIVVRNLETAMRKYIDDYAIGPCDTHEFNAGSAEDLHEDGRAVERSWRLATTMVGRVQWELIEPLDDESDYARFLAEKGEGVHHIAVAPTNFDQALADQAKKGRETVLSGTFSGIRVAYLPQRQRPSLSGHACTSNMHLGERHLSRPVALTLTESHSLYRVTDT